MPHCPNCGHELNALKLDGVEVDHCPNCGGSFFDENEINRLSLEAARSLLKDKKTEFVSGKGLVCPRDGANMKVVKEEAVPQFVNLLKCDRCGGIFAHPSDLVNFKKAQEAKLNFFKIWRTPLPSLKSVMVYGFILLAAALSLYSFSFLKTKQSLQSQADEIVTAVKISRADGQAVVYFVSESPVGSRAIFKDQKTGEQIEKIISHQPTTVHILLVEDIPLSADFSLKLVLTSGLAKIETKPIPFVQN